jgi:cytochrome c biogenesis protein CcmG/thiol:disulfide interchange protein DsbE
MHMVKTELVLRAVIGILLAAVVFVIIGSFRERVTIVGDTAPDFSIVTDTGHTVTRSNFGGKLLVLNFWATWCPPCVQEMPSLDSFQKQFASSGVVVLGISVDKSEKAYRDFLRRANVAFQTARDPSAKISSDYGTFKYPETYIINTSGKVVQKIIGPTNWTDADTIRYVKSLIGS